MVHSEMGCSALWVLWLWCLKYINLLQWHFECRTFTCNLLPKGFEYFFHHLYITISIQSLPNVKNILGRASSICQPLSITIIQQAAIEESQHFANLWANRLKYVKSNVSWLTDMLMCTCIHVLFLGIAFGNLEQTEIKESVSKACFVVNSAT